MRLRALLGIWVLGAGAPAEEMQPLRQVGAFPLAGVRGRMDHLAADLKGKRLFVAALENNTLEVLDTENGRSIQRVPIQEPQGVLFMPDSGQVAVTSGKEGSCRVHDGATFKLLHKVDLGSDADNVRYDAAEKRIYVGYGEGGLAVIDAGKGQRVGDVKLPAHPESFQLEKSGKRVFVNVPRTKQVLVVDRERLAVAASWPLKDAESNYPMALDEARRRLFLGCRKPARILVLDTGSGKTVQSLECGGDTDDLFFDAERKRIYVSCGEGVLDVFDAAEPDHLKRLARLPTAPRARTSLFVPEQGLLYLAVPRTRSQDAELRAYLAAP